MGMNSEEGVTQVLLIRALMTPPIAEALKCRASFYSEDGVPLRGITSGKLTARLDGADVTLGSDLKLRCSLIRSFEISHPKTNAANDTSLELSARLHFQDAGLELESWVQNTNKGEFALTINALQEDFGFDEDEQSGEDEPADTHSLVVKRGRKQAASQ